MSVKQDRDKALHTLYKRTNHNPHDILGLVSTDEGKKVIRVWRPEAETIHIELKGEIVVCNKIHEWGLFEVEVDEFCSPHDYRIYHSNGILALDPYVFSPSFGEFDLYLFAKGEHYQLYEVMGARLALHEGVKGVRFTVWAPKAQSVSVVGDFNAWDGRVNPMKLLGNPGIWEVFIPSLETGEKYKFEVVTSKGEILTKIDPFTFMTELRPSWSSIVTKIHEFEWTDEDWMNKRQNTSFEQKPLQIYEVHLGSWKKKEDLFPNYRQLALDLLAYCKEMGFTHVEILPVTEHPLDESWGYQVTGYYAPTSRYGTFQDFQYFVNYLHEHGVGVILDWVPGHFPTDLYSLGMFDGEPLYEHDDPHQRLHPHWQTHIFNFGNPQVANFLIANALFWLQVLHVDGLRVDAVASMLYLDYGRNYGEWQPNRFGDNKNLEAIDFFKHLNAEIKNRAPGTIIIAEESTAFPRITVPVDQGGLGFDLKWNMGWMNDTLRFFSRPADERKQHLTELTFGFMYAFKEKYILPLSHDEVVHEKNSLLSKMPGDTWEKFANLRLLFGYMACHPGKTLLFMGGELGEWKEWDCKKELDWSLLSQDQHRGVQKLVRDLNHLVIDNSALYAYDFEEKGFDWVFLEDKENCIIYYLRKSDEQKLLIVHNFLKRSHSSYFIPIEGVQEIEEIFNSDNEQYGGSGFVTHPPRISTCHDEIEKTSRDGVQLSIAPLATMIFRLKMKNENNV